MMIVGLTSRHVSTATGNNVCVFMDPRMSIRIHRMSTLFSWSRSCRPSQGIRDTATRCRSRVRRGLCLTSVFSRAVDQMPSGVLQCSPRSSAYKMYSMS